MLRRFLNLLAFLSLFLCCCSALSWPISYWRGAVLELDGFGIGVENGGIYLVGPDFLSGRIEARTFRAGNPVEEFANQKVQRWKPFRYLHLRSGDRVIVFPSWFITLLTAIPPLLSWRAWRKRRRQSLTRGFPIQSAPLNAPSQP
ncbi:MAG TPA: hypothetical protein VGQ99_18570 [Tepidisphaeraceae bacterium]|nr:hypothetical protein [Tepidisphaeraceae bacterium]